MNIDPGVSGADIARSKRAQKFRPLSFCFAIQAGKDGVNHLALRLRVPINLTFPFTGGYMEKSLC